MNDETITVADFTRRVHRWAERARRNPRHWDALISAYVDYLPRIPDTVRNEDGQRVFGWMGETWQRMAAEVIELWALQDAEEQRAA